MFAAVKDRVMAVVAGPSSSLSEASNDDPWGPTGPQMDKVLEEFESNSGAVGAELLERLQYKGSKWRRCYKSLLILDHLARTVKIRHVEALQEFIPEIRVIANNFAYVDDVKGIDHGISVRERAKKLVELLSNEELLTQERERTAKTRSTIHGVGSSGSTGGYGSESSSSKYSGHGSNSVPSSSTTWKKNRYSGDDEDDDGGNCSGRTYRSRVAPSIGDEEKTKPVPKETGISFVGRSNSQTSTTTSTAASAAPMATTTSNGTSANPPVVPTAVATPAPDPFAFLDQKSAPQPQPQPTTSAPMTETPSSSAADDFSFFQQAQPAPSAPAPSATTATTASSGTTSSGHDDFDFFLQGRTGGGSGNGTAGTTTAAAPPPVAGQKKTDPMDFFN